MKSGILIEELKELTKNSKTPNNLYKLVKWYVSGQYYLNNMYIDRIWTCMKEIRNSKNSLIRRLKT